MFTPAPSKQTVYQEHQTGGSSFCAGSKTVVEKLACTETFTFLQVAADLLEALCYMHVDAPRLIPALKGEPVVHRDLKVRV